MKDYKGTQEGEAIGVIPARAGSTGVPGKNWVDFNGKPLIQWTIEAAQESRAISKVLVSSNDPKILEICQRLEVDAIVRPEHLSRATTPTKRVTQHCLQSKGVSDATVVVLLQPTSPLRSAFDIDQALARWRPGTSVVSVTRTATPVEWIYKLDPQEELLRPLLPGPLPRRQEATFGYVLNGAIYCARAADIRSDGDFFRLPLVPYVMPAHRSVDIDTHADLETARLISVTVRG